MTGAIPPDLDRSRFFASAAMTQMERLGIPPTPENFAIWFSYCGNTDPVLRKTIDALVAGGRAFTQDVTSELYERHLGLHRQQERLHKISQQIESIVSRALGTLSDAEAGARQYGEALGETAANLAHSSELDHVREILREVMDETERMIVRSDLLERQLNRSTEEIGELRKQVADVSREAMTDGLTGIGNRKLFDQRIRALSAEAVEQATPLALLLLDIDHFKNFNDTYGHQFGDLVLRLVAKEIVDGIKGRDLATRYGGEEFAVLLPDTRVSDAAKLAENLRESIASKTVIKRDTRETLGVVTISIGVSGYRPGEALDEMVARADAALYRAKQTGRNRVVSEGALEGGPAPVRPPVVEVAPRR